MAHIGCRLSFVLACLLIWNESRAQSSATEIVAEDCAIPWKNRKKIAIQEVAIRDTLLIREINTMIREETEQSEMFKKGLGYIYVIPDYDLDENIVRSYYINVDYTGLRSMKEDSLAYLAYPDFYSFVAGRLIFIKLQMLDGMLCVGFTNRSMRNIRKIQDRFLEKEKSVDVYDSQGQKIFTDKHFRIDYFKLHGGKYIYIYGDGTYEVKPDRLR